MKITLFVLFLVLFVVPVSVYATDYPNYYDRYVNDFAHIFSPEQTAYLSSLLSGVEQNSTAQVVVVTVENLSGMAPSQYAVELATKWGVGQASTDNGLLILYAKTENKIFAATGYGLEGILPDSKLGRLLDNYYVPYRDQGNVTLGIIAFTEQVANVIENSGEAGTGQGNNSFWNDNTFLIVWFVIIFFFVFLPIIASVARSRQKCSVCGEKMKFVRTEGSWGSDGVYDIYKCPNGHVKKIKRSRAALLAAGGFAGGGGFGGGGGGGGFGGGGFGGGGAGR